MLESETCSRSTVRKQLYATQQQVEEWMAAALSDWTRGSVAQHPGLRNVPRAVSQEASLPLTCFPVAVATWETFEETQSFLRKKLQKQFGRDPLMQSMLNILEHIRLVNEATFVPCSAEFAWVETPFLLRDDALAIASPFAPFFAALQHPNWFRQTSLAGERGLFPGVICTGLMLPDGSTPILAAHQRPVIKRPITPEARVLLDQGLPYATALRPAFMGRTLPPPPPSLTGSSVR